MMKIYRDLGFKIHYLMSFIGGSMELISFVYFYKALIGYMTSNMIFSVISIYNGEFTFISTFHMQIILFWMIIATLYHLFYFKFKSKIDAIPNHRFYFYVFIINLFVLLIFVFYGHVLYAHDAFGNEPSPVITPLIILGLIFMFIHNFVIKHGGSKYPTNTAVVTSTYILMSTSFAALLMSNNRRDFIKKYHEVRHYFLVLFHFFMGATVTFILQKYMDFYSLFLPLGILLFLILHTRRYPAKK
ncbi:MAG: YoaK family protein [Cardiobacteriaceae bacterium]|nr:YoaK family protein [Cardiobacteriaceae bacterium]